MTIRKILLFIFGASIVAFFSLSIRNVVAISSESAPLTESVELALFTQGSKYQGFLVTKSLEIEELQCTLTELTHEKSGAQVVHIGAKDPENVFCISFRTLPESSNGVAHVLEHTVLKGSKKFPVKSPFFSMTRRSLNTFMNASTYQDFTCYPVASQVEKDFYNLFEVYLDATFHPLLDEVSFAQEGHRLEFSSEVGQVHKPELIYKGVVYNEMKGALAPPISRTTKAINAALYPHSTYRFISGGSPLEIPSLTREYLMEFHKKYYQPSNCIFYFYGNLPLQKHLDFLAQHALQDAEKTAPIPPIAKQKRFSQEVRQELFYPASAEDAKCEDKTIVSFSWLTTSILNSEEILALRVLDSALMDTDASPLTRELLSTGMCTQARSYLDTLKAEVPYSLYLEGCKTKDADSLEAVLRRTLIRIADEGIPERTILSAMHGLELESSEIGRSEGPFGMSLFVRSIPLKQHGGKVENGLRIHTLFKELKRTLQENPSYFHDLIYKHFVNNKHFVRIVMIPSNEFAKKEAQIERDRLTNIQKSLTQEDTQKIIALADELKRHQENDDSCENGILPTITLQDVPQKVPTYALARSSLGNIDVFYHNTFTNHLSYYNVVLPVAELPAADLWLIRLYAALIPELGAGTRSYNENLEYIQENTGGIAASLALNQQADNPNTFCPALHIKGKALDKKQDKLASLLLDVATSPNFSEKERLKELIFKHYTDLQSSLSQAALNYATTAALCPFNNANYVAENWYGVSYFNKIKELAENFDTQSDAFVEKLSVLQKTFLSSGRPHLVLTCDEDTFNAAKNSRFFGLADIQVVNMHEANKWKPEFSLPCCTSFAYEISAPVAFNTKAFQALAYSHPDSANIALSSCIFKNATLHKRIREQGGAYGGGAMYNPGNGNFFFFSYRDPNIASTELAFNEAVQNVMSGNFTERNLEEAKFEFLQKQSAPVAPGGRADFAYICFCEGKTELLRQEFRNMIFNARCHDIQMATKNHIAPNYKKSALVSFSGKELIERENKKLQIPLKLQKIGEKIFPYDPSLHK